MWGARRKRIFFGSFLLGIAVGILAIPAGAAEKAFIDSGKIVYGEFTDITTMDPAEAFIPYSLMVARNASESLLQYNYKDYSIEPLLAESWQVSEDGAIFRLRKGVKFHDGTEFNAEAVRFNWKRVMAINKAPATWLREIKDIQVIDNHTIRLVTEKNWAFLLDVLASPRIFLLVSPTAVKTNATKEDPWATKWFQNHTCGTGPYMAKEWVPNQYVTLVRNKDYWKGWSGKHFSEAVYKIVREAGPLRMMMLKGEVDLVRNMPPEYWEVLDADPKITTAIFPSFSEYLLLMNNARGPLTDKNLRWAVTYAFDYDAFRKVINAPAGNMLIGPVYKQDLKKALEYKNKSAYAGRDVEILITYAAVEEHKKLALIAQSNLKEIGINVRIKALTWPTFSKEVYGDPKEAGDIYTIFSTLAVADPYGVIYRILHSNSSKTGGSNLGYVNAEFDKLLDQARVTIDRKKRMALYEKAKALPVEDAAYVWVTMRPYVVIHRDSIKVHPSTKYDALGGVFYFYDLYRD